MGAMALSSSMGVLYEWISQYTWHSRTRLAMSCLYCPPKSSTTTNSRGCADCFVVMLFLLFSKVASLFNLLEGFFHGEGQARQWMDDPC